MAYLANEPQKLYSWIEAQARPLPCCPLHQAAPELKSQYGKALALLEINPHHPSLRLHALSGRLHGLHSVSINLSYRMTLELLMQDQQIIPVNVGDHDEVYG